MLTPTSNTGAGSVVKTTDEPTVLKLQAHVVEFRLLEEDRNMIRFGLKLRLTFVNGGSESVILLKQNFGVGAEMLARSCEDAKEGKYLYTSTHWPSVSRALEWANWRRQIDTRIPSPSLLSVLGPGNSLSVDVQTAINIEKGGNFDRTNKTWDEIKRSATIWLQVEIQTWPTNLEPNHDPENLELGQSLRKRWMSYGKLYLERLRSEPIQLQFPSPSSPGK